MSQDEIDQEIRQAVDAEEAYCGELLVDIDDEPKNIKHTMKKGLENVNKRYGYKPKK